MRFLKSLLAGALALGMTTSVAVAGGHGWQPKKPVEFIIMAGAGGGADQIARLLQGIIDKRACHHVPLFQSTSLVVQVPRHCATYKTRRAMITL
jgi:tripartite-type tricarboxylate transporter receptor subunit TctC